MEVSAYSTTHYFFSSESSLMVRNQRVHQSRRYCQPISPTRRRNSRSLLWSSNGGGACKENRFKVLSSQQKEVPVVEAGSMNEVYDVLAERLLPTAAMASSPHLKYIVGIAGCPGAGKSTLASEVARRVNNLWTQKAPVMDFVVDPPEIAISLPMDGFHLYRHQLDKMENPEEAHARRGAPWTFDPASLLKCLQKLKSEGSVYMPSFDHAVGDPVEDDIFVSPQLKVVIIEGNYLLLEEETWKEISSILDEKWEKFLCISLFL